MTAVLIFMGWSFNPVVWGAPWWYLLTAALSITLMVFAPTREAHVQERPSRE